MAREGEEGYILSWPGKGRRVYIVLAREGEEGYILSWPGKGGGVYTVLAREGEEPSLINLMVSVDVKRHIYLLT